MTAIFFILALILLLSAAAVVALRNPIYSALAPVLHLVVVAALFAMLDAHFLATVQLIVYAGAIVVLVLFVLMLLNLKTEAPRPLNGFLVGFGVLSAAGLLVYVVPPLQGAFHIFPDPVEPVQGGARAIGSVLFSRYVFPFEAASMLIMAAIVGAVMVAKRHHGSRHREFGRSQSGMNTEEGA